MEIYGNTGRYGSLAVEGSVSAVMDMGVGAGDFAFFFLFSLTL